MHAYALELSGAERARLVPDRVRDAQATEIVDEARSAQRAHHVGWQSELFPGPGRKLGHGRRMTEAVRRFQVDEVRDRQERGIETLAGEHHRKRRLGID